MFGTEVAGLPLDQAELCAWTTDRVEQLLARAQATIDAARAVQLTLLAELDRRQVNTADGYRTMAEWAAQKIDEAPETAATLVQTARTITPSIRAALQAGDIGYTRAVETTRLAVAGAADPLAISWSYDIGGLRGRVAEERRITPSTEGDAHDGRYLHLQPTLDETAYRLWGMVAGFEGRIVAKALDERADEFPAGIGSRSQRRADALVSIAQDSLDGTAPNGDPSGSRTPLVTAFVDTTSALPSGGELGMRLEAGPRIGPRTLEAILCDARVEVLELTGDGTVIDHGTSRTLKPEIRRAVLFRDGGRCVIAGCTSGHRLEVHHLVPRSQGGDDALDNLATLCWFHHHVAVHRDGMRIDPHSPPFARRLLRPPGADPPI